MANREQTLYKTAEAQQGYFTYRQAIGAGYCSAVHAYHVKTGTWLREHRGIYRLSRFPTTPEGQYVLWSLWSCNRHGVPQGVFSHQTALSLYELSDVMPLRLHMTVPPGFRRNAAVPGVLLLHKAALLPAEFEKRQGFRVVTPLRAVAELLLDGRESHDHLRQALEEGLRRGLITRAQLAAHHARAALSALLTGRPS